jgi:hypothetical protein
VDSRDIKPKQCYRLESGQIIRVMTVYASQVRYDVFDERDRKWVQSAGSIPAAMVKEPCPDPSEKST